jgi:biotin carboxyl carrier protein
MKYVAILKGKEKEVEVMQYDRNLYRVSIDGESHEIDARLCAHDSVSVLIDHVSYDISFSCEDTRMQLYSRNNYYDIDVLDERRVRMQRVRSELDVSGPEVIKTSMPGKVVRVLVEKGQVVEPGLGIILIEAMKMENEIRCHRGGVVKAVHVSAGQTVEGGPPLVEIEPAA